MSVECEKPVLLFSGQGSQKVGMGADLAKSLHAQDVLNCASDIFEFDVAKLMTEGPQQVLDSTRYAQAAITTLSLALYQTSKEYLPPVAACLGFSLGQISALYASGMLTLEQTFQCIQFRAEAMERAAQEHPGSMCALLGAEEEAVRELCAEQARDEVLVPANYNCPGQIVISGSSTAVERAYEAWVGQKKRAMMLATSGAFHSPLMSQAADEFASYLEGVTFSEPQVPLIDNVSAAPLSAKNAKEQLSAHLTQPVRFSQSVASLCDQGARFFVELGFGGVLVGLVKRIDKTTTRVLVDTVEKATELRNEKE